MRRHCTGTARAAHDAAEGEEVKPGQLFPVDSSHRFATRNTQTGRSTENIVLQALRENHYQCRGGGWMKRNIIIATHYGTGHTPDWLALDMSVEPPREVIIEVKYQGVPGSIYWKILAEIVRLARSMRSTAPRFGAAYIVIVGHAAIPSKFLASLWARDYTEDIRGAETIHCVTLDRFVQLCNTRRL